MPDTVSVPDATGRTLRRLLQGIVLIPCLGWAVAHLIGDSPYRTLAWDEGLLSPLLDGLGWSWDAWVSDHRVDAAIGWFGWMVGSCFLLTALTVLRRPPPAWALPLLALPLALLTLARWNAHSWDPVWPLEFALRACLPLVLWLLIRDQLRLSPRIATILLVCCLATFAGHASYALDWFPTPSVWPELVQRATGLQGDGATYLLHAMATWDLLLVVAACWPPSRGAALLGMAAWGGITALARLLLIDHQHLIDTAPLALAACLERLPHAGLPFLLWLSRREAHAEDPRRRRSVETPDHAILRQAPPATLPTPPIPDRD